jgi:hypothetical protein
LLILGTLKNKLESIITPIQQTNLNILEMEFLLMPKEPQQLFKLLRLTPIPIKLKKNQFHLQSFRLLQHLNQVLAIH